MTEKEEQLGYVKRRLSEACAERDYYLDRLIAIVPKIKQYAEMIKELEEASKNDRE